MKKIVIVTIFSMSALFGINYENSMIYSWYDMIW